MFVHVLTKLSLELVQFDLHCFLTTLKKTFML